MIATIIAIIYISFICWSYGSMCLNLLSKFSHTELSIPAPTTVTCFTGLALIGVLFTALSLFFPVGHILSQLFLFLPALFWLLRKRSALAITWKSGWQRFTNYPAPVLAVLFSGILLILIMHSRVVNHPDTLNYHAQHIEWVKNYKAVPGIVHLNVNLGTQSAWFILSGLFSFSFTGSTALTFINAAVLCWFIIFITKKVNETVKGTAPVVHGLLWLLLLILAFWSYTQIRLTATSASPDFIAALYTWLIIYLFIKSDKAGSKVYYALLVFISLFAVTLKLSALPCILLSFYAWYRYGKVRTAAAMLYPFTAAAIVGIPYLVNNVINTGYLLFPSPFPDLFSVDWKLSHNSMVLFQEYVKTYARTHVDYNPEQITKVAQMKMNEWMPIWWQIRSVADKLILLSVPALIIFALLSIKKILYTPFKRLRSAFVFTAIGVLFWFIEAPDPRFGFGFLIPFSGILLCLLLNNVTILQRIRPRVFNFFLVLFSISIFSYTAYRLVYFFSPSNLVQPAGVATIQYTTSNCNGVPLHMPVGNIECGITPVPCTNFQCGYFVPRGSKIEEGFRERNPN
jgi:hypothetical protein